MLRRLLRRSRLTDLSPEHRTRLTEEPMDTYSEVVSRSASVANASHRRERRGSGEATELVTSLAAELPVCLRRGRNTSRTIREPRAKELARRCSHGDAPHWFDRGLNILLSASPG